MQSFHIQLMLILSSHLKLTLLKGTLDKPLWSYTSIDIHRSVTSIRQGCEHSLLTINNKLLIVVNVRLNLFDLIIF